MEFVAGNNIQITPDATNKTITIISTASGNVTGVKGGAESTYRTGNVDITKANIGLGNVDNTSDLNKPISTATQAALDEKTSAMIVDVSDTQPTDPDNKLWIPEVVTETQVPTWAEHQALSGAISSMDTDDVANESNVTGATVSDALDTLDGAINGKMSIAPERIEMYPASGSSHGGYIDFHYGGDTSVDYTSRIIEHASGYIKIYGNLHIDNPLAVEDGGTGNTSVDTTPTQNSTKMVTSGGVYSAIATAQSVTSYELIVHSGTTATELGRAIMLVYGKLFLLHGIVTVSTALSSGTVIYDLPSYNYGMASISNNPIVEAANTAYTTVGIDNTNKTLKVTYNGGMNTGRYEMFLMGWIN